MSTQLASTAAGPALSLGDTLDRLAIGASAACIAHCVALPIVFAMLPALSSVIAVPEAFHLWMLVLAVPTSLISLALGFRARRAVAPLIAGLIGLLGLALGAFWPDETAETLLTVAGGLSLAGAHIGNWRVRHRP